MGLDPNTLGENVWSKVPKAERPPGYLTAAEATEKGEKRTEADEQRTLANYLSLAKSRGELYFLWFRIDKPTRGTPGHPDFSIWLSRGRTLLIEMKSDRGKLSREQQKVSEAFGALDHLYIVVYSGAEGIKIVQKLKE
jgi:hypothetical protein